MSFDEVASDALHTAEGVEIDPLRDPALVQKLVHDLAFAKEKAGQLGAVERPIPVSVLRDSLGAARLLSGR